MRRSDRLSQQRHLQAITKQLGGTAYAQGRLADLLDMHLTRRGLCIVTLDERNLLPHPTLMREAPASESS